MAQTLEKAGSSSARSRAQRWFPFVDWFPMSPVQVRADLLAGITVALVLIPQSMAYAQPAGLPVVYGLYASFVPAGSVLLSGG